MAFAKLPEQKTRFGIVRLEMKGAFELQAGGRSHFALDDGRVGIKGIRRGACSLLLFIWARSHSCMALSPISLWPPLSLKHVGNEFRKEIVLNKLCFLFLGSDQR